MHQIENHLQVMCKWTWKIIIRHVTRKIINGAALKLDVMASPKQITFLVPGKDSSELSITKVKKVTRPIREWLYLQHLPNLSFITEKYYNVIRIYLN